MPEFDENLRGKVCVGSCGRIGVVTEAGTLNVPEKPGSSVLKTITVWHGMGFDGKGTWASSKPCVVHESVEEYRAMLIDRFGGKMSFLG